jgi:hypothetical protein
VSVLWKSLPRPLNCHTKHSRPIALFCCYLICIHTLQACLPGSGPIKLLELDTQIASMWENHVYTVVQVCCVLDFSARWQEMDIVPLNINWEQLCNKIAEGMVYTTNVHFSKWCCLSRKKRKGSNANNSSSGNGPLYLRAKDIELECVKRRKVSV